MELEIEVPTDKVVSSIYLGVFFDISLLVSEQPKAVVREGRLSVRAL